MADPIPSRTDDCGGHDHHLLAASRSENSGTNQRTQTIGLGQQGGAPPVAVIVATAKPDIGGLSNVTPTAQLNDPVDVLERQPDNHLGSRVAEVVSLPYRAPRFRTWSSPARGRRSPVGHWLFDIQGSLSRWT